jgi:hypothetical protein
MCTLSRHNVVTKSRHDIESKKIMFTLIWNPIGFCVVDRFPNHTKMNIAYFMTNILIVLEKQSFLEAGRRMKNDL